MADRSDHQDTAEDERLSHTARNPTPLALHNERELDDAVEYEYGSSTTVDSYRHGGLHRDVRPSQWADDARRNARSPFAHPLGVITHPPSPSRIPIPTYTQAVVRHHIALHRDSSLPRNIGMLNLHELMGSVHEQEHDDVAAVRHPANTLLRGNSSLPRNEGRMDLLEPRENLQEEEDVVDPATPLARSRRIWNFTEVHEAIRQNEENGFDPPTPPPPYPEAVLMPQYEVEGRQTRQRFDSEDRNESHREQAMRPSFFQGFRRLDSPQTQASRSSIAASQTYTLP